MYQAKHLSPAEIDRVFEQKLKELEVMHLAAMVNQRVLTAFGPGQWDPARGEDLIAAVRHDWQQCQAAAGDPEPAGVVEE